MDSDRSSEDIEHNPHISVVKWIKNPINVNIYQVTEFNKDVQQWENRFLTLKDLVRRNDLPESEKIKLLPPLLILTLEHLVTKLLSQMKEWEMSIRLQMRE